jgi:hypothetical protein
MRIWKFLLKNNFLYIGFWEILLKKLKFHGGRAGKNLTAPSNQFLTET